MRNILSPHLRMTAVYASSALLAGMLSLAYSPTAHGDPVAYLVNVTVRPGYNFANADTALQYGYGVCDKVANQRSFSAVVADVKNDLATFDDYQALYLINQSVNELCPAQIWGLRQSAAGYRPGSRA